MTALISMEQPGRAFFWTAPVSDQSELATEDPLALDYVAQQVGLSILPTLTTRSSRAQAFAMVLYGLWLADVAIDRYGYPSTDEVRRELFERWERFWALATLESRNGVLPRGDWDTMRGVRGARAAYRPGPKALPTDFRLISRQQELGNLGAYLAPLRRSGLVKEGTVQPGPAGLEIIDAFWDEAEENRHRGRYEEYALIAMDKGRATVERSNGNLTLRKLGEQSRLTSLRARNRVVQQRRLEGALFERARDRHTFAVSRLVEAAAKANLRGAREVLDAAIAGRLGEIGDELRDLLVTARRFGDVMQELVAAFDRAYVSLDRAGWVAPRERVAREAFGEQELSSLQLSCERLVEAPSVGEIRRLPAHGAACLRLVEDLRKADPVTALERLLAYHATVQRDRRRGEGWIRDEGGKLLLLVTSYSARPEAPRYPSFKLDVVRTLLFDLGRVAEDRAGEAPGVDG